jgi:hypothetical protein
MCAAAAQRKVKNLVDPIHTVLLLLILLLLLLLLGPPTQTIPKIMFPKAYFKTEF